MKKHISNLRRQYHGNILDEKLVLKDPLQQFRKWFDNALESGVPDPNAMALATANKYGVPSVRIVLLKDFDKKGFTFFTNYNSQKGKEIHENPNGSILFFWPQLHQQIRIEGVLKKVHPRVSERYFNERPFESRIAACISPQSEVVDSKISLENKYLKFQKGNKGKTIACPAFWGGYCLKPKKIEFWQGQPNRLHDRVQYNFQPVDKTWNIVRIAP